MTPGVPLLAAALLAQAPAAPPPPVAGRVVAVHDGDTATVATADGRTLHVRLLLVDAPELLQHPWGIAAAYWAHIELAGRPVTLEFDRTRPDRYGRTLAYVVDAKGCFNERLVAAGWGFAYNPGPPLSRSAAVARAEAAARKAGRGVWRAGQCPLQVPSEFRKALRAARHRGPGP